MYDAIKVVYGSDPVAFRLAEKLKTLSKYLVSSGLMTPNTSRESGIETNTKDIDINHILRETTEKWFKNIRQA